MLERRTLLKTPEAAKVIGMSRFWLEQERVKHRRGQSSNAPPYYRIGTNVRYDAAELEAWLQERRQS